MHEINSYKYESHKHYSWDQILGEAWITLWTCVVKKSSGLFLKSNNIKTPTVEEFNRTGLWSRQSPEVCTFWNWLKVFQVACLEFQLTHLKISSMKGYKGIFFSRLGYFIQTHILMHENGFLQKRIYTYEISYFTWRLSRLYKNYWDPLCNKVEPSCNSIRLWRVETYLCFLFSYNDAYNTLDKASIKSISCLLIVTSSSGNIEKLWNKLSTILLYAIRRIRRN